jgi:hypothetical protein
MERSETSIFPGSSGPYHGRRTATPCSRRRSQPSTSLRALSWTEGHPCSSIKGEIIGLVPPARLPMAVTWRLASRLSSQTTGSWRTFDARPQRRRSGNGGWLPHSGALKLDASERDEIPLPWLWRRSGTAPRSRVTTSKCAPLPKGIRIAQFFPEIFPSAHPLTTQGRDPAHHTCATKTSMQFATIRSPQNPHHRMPPLYGQIGFAILENKSKQTTYWLSSSKKTNPARRSALPKSAQNCPAGLRRKLSAFSHQPSARRPACYRRLSAFIGGPYGFSRMSERPPAQPNRLKSSRRAKSSPSLAEIAGQCKGP